VNPQDPLAELRDIHLPAPVSWWPPAPGWWILSILVLATLVFCLIWLIKRYRSNHYRREALAILMQLETSLGQQPMELCHAALALLRRTAKSAYPGQGLEAELLPQLLQRLNLSCRKPVFDVALQQQLKELPYQANPQIPAQIPTELLVSTQRWIKKHRRGVPC